MSLTRRQFLQLAGTFGLAAAAPMLRLPIQPAAVAWPLLALTTLPGRQRSILLRLPRLELDQAGSLLLKPGSAPGIPLPVAQTQWNRENSHDWDRLQIGHPWAIVLHWFGDDPQAQNSLSAYLNGFDGLRRVHDYETRTSAHVLVGKAHPANPGQHVGIVQTQLAHADGTPFVASHLPMLDYESHLQRQQYFVRALYQLNYQEPAIHSILQDWFDGWWVDPNMRSLGLEITGRDFDSLQGRPPDQQVANTVAVVAALMRRYGVRGSSVLGHLEIQTNKPDPGKKFMALVRCLLGSLALTGSDALLKELCFAQYLGEDGDPWRAVRVYFQFTRDYLLLTGRPNQMYEWEADSGYWTLVDQLPGHTHTPLPPAAHFQPPLPGAAPVVGATFLVPHDHAGVDLYLPANQAYTLTDVQLSAAGECLYTGPLRNQHGGFQAFFRHRQPDGAEVLSHYANLSRLADLLPGTLYPAGQVVGQLDSGPGRAFILHFGIVYGAAWETTLRSSPEIPLNASVTWIRERFLDPLAYLEGHAA
jgi:hypothetical protein